MTTKKTDISNAAPVEMTDEELQETGGGVTCATREMQEMNQSFIQPSNPGDTIQ